MDALERKFYGITGTALMLVIWAFAVHRGVGQFNEPAHAIIFAAFIIVAGLTIFIAVARSPSGEKGTAEPVAYPATSPVHYEEAAPEEVESRTPALLCPDCGYENPWDAEFCIECGRQLK